MDEKGSGLQARWRLVLAGLATWVIPARARSRRNQSARETSTLDQSARGQAARTALPPALTNDIADALTHLMEATRQRAIADGVWPVPAAVSRALRGYFPATLLQKVRFASGRAEPLTLPALAFSYGDVVAVTVGDVVLFKSERLAHSDLRLWAHELTHVMQYQRWGMDGFAEHYVRDTAAVEQEAVDNASRCVAWLTGHGT